MAIKTAVGKLAVTVELLNQIMQDLRLTTVSFEPRHANRLFNLPVHHRDPFDRMLIATALVEGCPIISSDREFKSYKGLQVIW
jgi:PIN domain nuclease of toxin-antitoxin system